MEKNQKLKSEAAVVSLMEIIQRAVCKKKRKSKEEEEADDPPSPFPLLFLIVV